MLLLEIEKSFRAIQGLKSPIRDAQGLPGLQPQNGYELTLKAAIAFEENQLTEQGWFVDSDAVDRELEQITAYLSSKSWTELFEYRPTFERIASWAFNELNQKVPQLSYITICNQTLGVNLTYNKG